MSPPSAADLSPTTTSETSAAEIHGVPYKHPSYVQLGWFFPGKFNIARVEHKANYKHVILKIINDKSEFERERKFLADLGKSSASDYVVELKDVLEPSNVEPRFGLIQELLGENLWDYLRAHPSLEELDRKNLALSVLNAIAALHSKRVVHGDLKPHQICFVLNQRGFKVKLIDFDSAFYLEDKKHRLDRYSDGYVAPEVHSASTNVFYFAKVEFSPGHTRSGITRRSCGIPTHDIGGPFPPRLDPR